MQNIEYRRAFLKMAPWMLAGTLAGCRTLEQQATATVTPTLRLPNMPPPALSPTRTPEAPTVNAISKAEMDKIVKDLNNEMQGDYIFSPNLDGSYGVTGKEGKPVPNILLNVDGKVYITETDGTKAALPPETVFMPAVAKDAPLLVYAGLDQVDVKSGAVSEISFDSTAWPTDPEHQSPRITKAMLPAYETWIRRQLESTGRLDGEFEGADPSMKWVIEEHNTVPWDVYGDGRIVSASTSVLVPVGTKINQPFNPGTAPELKKIPIRQLWSFVSLVDYPGVSVLPIFIENPNPNAPEKYALFPGAVGSDQINIDPAKPYSLKNITLPSLVNNTPIQKYLIVGDVIHSGSTIDGTGGKNTLPYFIEGKDPEADAARRKILEQGKDSGSFDGSAEQLWIVSYWAALP